jgi:hypothetical protein
MLTFKALIAHYGRGQAAKKPPRGFVEWSTRQGNPEPNTCAVRLAYAIFKTDKSYFKSKKARRPWREWLGLPTKADELAVMLTRHEKKPTLVKARKEIAGKAGIIFFDKITGFGGSGHISLWDGTCVADDGDYFGSSERIYFYELAT